MALALVFRSLIHFKLIFVYTTLAWKIPRLEEPGRLQSVGSLRVGHDWATSLSLFTFMNWRRKWQPTPVFLPGESQGQGSLVGFHLWGGTESDKSTYMRNFKMNTYYSTPQSAVGWIHGCGTLPNHKVYVWNFIYMEAGPRPLHCSRSTVLLTIYYTYQFIWYCHCTGCCILWLKQRMRVLHNKTWGKYKFIPLLLHNPCDVAWFNLYKLIPTHTCTWKHKW